MPGITDPSTWPQIPAMHLLPTAFRGATRMSQVEVPMIFTRVLSVIPPPTAPMWASNAPTATVVPGSRPSRLAHSSVSPPALRSDVCVSVKRRWRRPFRRGSILRRNASGGRPSQSECHIALCPAAHLLLFMARGSTAPVRSAGIQSQCSTQEYAAARTFPSSRMTCRIFDQNHSEE